MPRRHGLFVGELDDGDLCLLTVYILLIKSIIESRFYVFIVFSIINCNLSFVRLSLVYFSPELPLNSNLLPVGVSNDVCYDIFLAECDLINSFEY